MSFHLHVMKQNVFKYARLHSFSITEWKIDTASKDETQLMLCSRKRKKLPDKNVKQTLPAILDPMLSKPLYALATTQTLPGLYGNRYQPVADGNKFQNYAAFAKHERLEEMARLLHQSSQLIFTTNDLNVLSQSTFYTKTDHMTDILINRENALVLQCYNHSQIKYNGDPSERIYQTKPHDRGIDNSSDTSSSSEKETKNNKSEESGPTQQQLNTIKDVLLDEFPVFFNNQLRIDIYDVNMVFENNYFGQTRETRGISNYTYQLMAVKSMVSLAYSKPVNMKVLGISSHIENGTVVVRWRIYGVPRFNLRFWKSWSKKEENIKWNDGISTFYLKNDGLVHRHKVDKVIMDQGPQVEKSQNMATKLALALGLTPKPSFENFLSIWMHKNDANL